MIRHCKYLEEGNCPFASQIKDKRNFIEDD